MPSVPRNLKAVVISSNVVKLRWKRPEKSNGIITQYQINWIKVKSALDRSRRSLGHSLEEVIYGVPQQLNEIREHFIRNLTPYSTYNFKVRERTPIGWGPFSNRIHAVTFEGGRLSCTIED